MPGDPPPRSAFGRVGPPPQGGRGGAHVSSCVHPIARTRGEGAAPGNGSSSEAPSISCEGEAPPLLRSSRSCSASWRCRSLKERRAQSADQRYSKPSGRSCVAVVSFCLISLPRRALILPRKAGEGDHAKHGGGGKATRALADLRRRPIEAQTGCARLPPPPRYARSPSPALHAGEDRRTASLAASPAPRRESQSPGHRVPYSVKT